jgi:hypothetical protein
LFYSTHELQVALLFVVVVAAAAAAVADRVFKYCNQSDIRTT